MSRARTEELLRSQVDATGETDVEPAELEEANSLKAQLIQTREALEAERLKIEALRRNIEADHELVQKYMGEGRPLNAMVAAAAEKNQQQARAKFYQSLAGQQVTIQIHTHEDPRRNFPVFVALNGREHEIPRGVPYTLPGEYIEVLDNARYTSTVKEVGDDGMPTLRTYDHLSYPYVILSHGHALEDVAQAAH